MKKILFLLLIVSGFASAQTPPKFTKVNFAYNYVGYSADSNAFVPRYSGFPTFRFGQFGAGQLAVDSINGILYFSYGGAWHTGTTQWTTSGSDIYYNSGGAALGNTSVNSKAILDLVSTSKGFLTPRMNTGQQNAIASPPNGLIIYNTDSAALCYYNGSAWRKIGAGGVVSSIFPIQGTTDIKDGLSAEGAGLTNSGDQSTLLQTTLNSSSVNLLTFNKGDFTINGSVNCHGKKLQFKNGARLIGTGTIDSFLVDCDYQVQCFATTLSFTHPLNQEASVVWFGAIPDNSTNNRSIFQKVNDAYEGASGTTIYVPHTKAGRIYIFDSTFTITNAAFVGFKELYGAEFLFPASRIGVHLSAGSGGYSPSIANIDIRASAMNPNDGHVGFNSSNPLSNDPNDYFYHGIYLDAVGYVINCNVQDFSGHGIRVYASVGDVPATNASHSYFNQDRSAHNFGCGMYISGPDANQCSVFGLDFRDNGLVGIWDASFLGNQFFGCMGHNNGAGGRIGGHYKVSNINARTSFFGCYGEGGSNTDSLVAYGLMIGGIHENGIAGSGNWWVNNLFNRVSVLKGSGTNEGFTIENAPNMQWRWGDSLGAKILRFKSTNASFIDWKMDLNNDGSNIWQLGSTSAKIVVAGLAASTNTAYRSLLYESHAFHPLFIGNTLYQTAATTDSASLIASGYNRGDIINNVRPQPYEIYQWKNIVAGMSGRTAPTNYTEGRTATTDGTYTVVLNSPSAVLSPGYTVIINGIRGTILDTGRVSSTFFMKMDVAYPAGGPYSIQYGKPTWQAYGYATGTYLQKPSLTSNDYAFRYYATDTSAWFTWNGTLWIKDVVESQLDNFITTKVQEVGGFSSSTPGNIAIDTTSARRKLAFKYGTDWFYVAVVDSVSILDANAKQYIDSLIANGYTPSVAEKIAINNLVLSLKSNSLWTGRKAIYPMIGASANTCKFNLKNPTQYTLAWTGGWVYSSSGSDPNGSTGYADCGIDPNAVFGNNIIEMSYYTPEGTVSSGSAMGCDDGTNINYLVVGASGHSDYASGLFADRAETTPEYAQNGIYIGSRITTTDIKLYFNGSSIASNTTSDAVVSVGKNIYIGCRNSNGTPTAFNSQKCGYASIGNGLNSSDVSIYNGLIQTFITTLGR